MFKPNQKVRLIKHDDTNWTKQSRLNIGQVCTVNFLHPQGWIMLQKPSYYYIPPDCFELAYKTNRKPYHPSWF